MKCNVCGKDYTSPSLGGPGICPRCDCGKRPDGTPLTIEDSILISQRFQRGEKPYYIENWWKPENNK